VRSFFRKKDNQKERIARGWVLGIMVFVSNRLATLILFIIAISLSGCLVCHGENGIKRFFRIKPESTDLDNI
jgi:hypothetical protein